MKSKLVMRQVKEEDEAPLEEVTSAEVTRLDGVLGPANAIPFLLMRSEAKDLDWLDVVLRQKELERSAAASGSKKARAGSKHTLKVGGEVKFPINDCSDVEDAWGLRGHAKGVSQDRVESYIKSAASDLGCSVPGSDVQRYGKTISAATEQRLRDSIAVIQNLLGDTGSYAETPPTATLEDDSTLNKAADSNKEETVGEAVKEKEPKAPAVGVARKVTATKPVLKRQTHGEYDGTHSHAHADGDGGEHSHDHEHDGDSDHGHDHGDMEREQGSRVGPNNNVSMGGTGSGGRVSTPNLDASSAGGDIGTAGSVADLDVPQQNVVDGEGAMKAAVASTKAVVKLATSEEESPDISLQAVQRAMTKSFSDALAEGLKPLKEVLEKISNEDSRSQQKPFRRGAAPDQDYYLVRRDGGGLEATSDNNELKRALDALDPVHRDVLTRELAKNAHPLLANKTPQ